MDHGASAMIDTIPLRKERAATSHDAPGRVEAMLQTGYKLAEFDGRDWAWTLPASTLRGIDLEPPFEVRHQGEVPCCVSCAVVTAMEILRRASQEQQPLSALYNYYHARPRATVLENISIRASLDAARDYGVCWQSAHPPASSHRGPYAWGDALTAPSPQADLVASRVQLVDVDPDWNTLGYYRLNPMSYSSQWRSALSRGTPVVLGFHATQSYLSMEDGSTHELANVAGDSGGGLHAALVVGFDGSWFTIRDCRGSEFAKDGQWLLHEDIAATPWVIESWAIAAIER